MIDIREARAADVEAIRDIFYASYGSAYPHPQFYDVEQLTRFVYSDGQLLLVAEDADSGRVIGTASVILEVGALTDLVAEFGRLAVLPETRNSGVGRMLMRARLDRVRDRIHVGLVEARTVHPYTLRIAEANGFAPVGLVPLKMRTAARESLCLLTQYFGDALRLRRNHPRVVPEVYPLAQLALEHSAIESDVIVDEDAPAFQRAEGLALREMTTEGYSTLLRIERGRVRHREVFGPLRLHYGLFKLKAEHSHYLMAVDEGRILGAVGWNEDLLDGVTRIFELIALEDAVARFLLESFERTCRERGDIAVAEIDVSADAPRLQRTLLELGFLPAAYLPAMVFSEVERLDVVKMVRLYIEPEVSGMQLSPRAAAIADVVLKRFRSQRVQPQIEAVMGELRILEGMDTEQVRRLAGTCRVVSYLPGATIIAEGEPGSAFHILLSGRAEIWRAGVTQRLGMVGAGECLGEMSFLASGPHSATAIAVTPVETATLTHGELEALLRLRPDIGLTIYRNLAAGLGAKLGRVGQDPLTD